jgi:hypothetical protein
MKSATSFFMAVGLGRLVLKRPPGSENMVAV